MNTACDHIEDEHGLCFECNLDMAGAKTITIELTQDELKLIRRAVLSHYEALEDRLPQARGKPDWLRRLSEKMAALSAMYNKLKTPGTVGL